MIIQLYVYTCIYAERMFCTLPTKASAHFRFLLLHMHTHTYIYIYIYTCIHVIFFQSKVRTMPTCPRKDKHHMTTVLGIVIVEDHKRIMPYINASGGAAITNKANNSRIAEHLTLLPSWMQETISCFRTGQHASILAYLWYQHGGMTHAQRCIWHPIPWLRLVVVRRGAGGCNPQGERLH